MFLSSYLCKTTATPWPLGGFCWNKSIVILVYTEDNKSIQSIVDVVFVVVDVVLLLFLSLIFILLFW